MWLINCMLLVLGTVAAVCGISFLVRNKEASGNIRIYIFLIGNFAAIWCIFFGLIGFSGDFALCDSFRKAGDIGIVAFLATETFLILDISGVQTTIARIVKTASVLMGTADYLIFSQAGVNRFIREKDWTTWVADPEGAFNRAFHGWYILFTFLILFSFGIVWWKNTRIRRFQSFFFYVFGANFIMLFFCIPDTLLPAIGKPAVSTSGIGVALCAIVMWYGATLLGFFDIRVGNIRNELFDLIEAGVLVLDIDKQIAVMNRYSKKYAKMRKTDMNRLEDFFDITAEEAAEMLRLSVDDIYMTRLWNKYHTKAFSVRVNAVKDNFGEVFCYMCVYVDVTEEVEAVAKYEIASHAKSRFLAQMSHEIRTPINAVLGMNEMILRETEDEDILSYAESIDSAGNTLLSLINSILDFSKIEDGKMEIIPVRYDTASFINDLVHSIMQRADAKGLAFILNVDEALPCALIGDDVRFSQIIMNLLTNAVKYTDRGSVALSIRLKDKTDEKAGIFVSVKDTGIGIRKEDKEKMFESFGRLDEVKNHSIEGTGLGMSIVTSLLGMMDSKLQLESVYGEGSEFSFVVYQQIADETPIGDYEMRLKESVRKKEMDTLLNAPSARVLVVDDNEMNLKVAQNLLKLCQIKPDTAASGEETIEQMRQKHYDIVFLDHMMPGMDGMETLVRLKEQELIPDDTAMIALTANAVLGAKEGYLDAGFKDYLSKPIEVKELVHKLREYLPNTAYEEKTKDKEEMKMMEYYEENGDILEFPVEDDTDDSQKAAKQKGEEAAQNAKAYDRMMLASYGIDTQAGLKYCAGSEELYFEILTQFISSVDEKLNEAEALFEKGNWHEYEVKAHALKSNTKMIGAKALSDQAKALEDAAENEDIAYINENHEKFLSAYRNIADRIKESGME